MSTQTKTWIQIIGVTVGIVIVFRGVSAPAITASRLFGLAIMVPAYMLWVTARIQLGNSFAVRAEARQLVSTGLYSKIRNPVYVFGALFIGGFILAIGHPIWLLILIVIVPLQVIRARKEATVLDAKFGHVYREYRRGTWF
jgi:protein-S-isoprenylcysteine O-methyltransferase Ste14